MAVSRTSGGALMARRRGTNVPPAPVEPSGVFPDVLEQVFAEMEEKWRREAEEAAHG